MVGRKGEPLPRECEGRAPHVPQANHIPGRPVLRGRPRRPFFSDLPGTSIVRVGFGGSLPVGTSVRPTVISSSVGLRTRDVDCA